MSGSNFGTLFHISTWGESHGKGIGVVIDGCPAGLPLSETDIQKYLDRRKPGQSKYTTQRTESDIVEIQSGIFEGKTTGTPIGMFIRNEAQRSSDYSEIASYYRPGHADYTFDAKYGFRDYRGGGRSSGRETIGRVAAGAIASKFLLQLGIEVHAYTESIGDICIDTSHINLEHMYLNPFYMPDQEAAKKVTSYVDTLMSNLDSAGGVVACTVDGLPAGIGEPVFDKLDANLAKAIFSIGAVKGFEIGDGMSVAKATGSTNNDSFLSTSNTITTSSNHSGGILGGISVGTPVLLHAAFKPTPSIAKEQKTVTQQGDPITISIHGRHDPLIVPRAVVVVEAMTSITILDLLLQNMTSRMDSVLSFYRK